MPNKNAYEIRLDVLGMAHSDMSMKFLEKLNIYRKQDANGNLVNPPEDVIDKLFPKTSEIIARAEELYAFVEDKGI
jgi:hypothetical protein